MTEVEKIIRKHYSPKTSKFKTRGWEQCGEEIQRLIDKKQEAAQQTKSYERLIYGDQCRKLDRITDRVEGEYDSYFKVGGFYNWINGNDKLKNFIKNL